MWMKSWRNVKMIVQIQTTATWATGATVLTFGRADDVLHSEFRPCGHFFFSLLKLNKKEE